MNFKSIVHVSCACLATIHLYVPDVDAAIKKAVECGCHEVSPVMDCFWGERMGKVEDPIGFQWGIATQTEELTLGGGP